MKWYEQLLISEATAGLHLILARYASKYFTQQEQQAMNEAADAIAQLPQRIHGGGPPK